MHTTYQTLVDCHLYPSDRQLHPFAEELSPGEPTSATPRRPIDVPYDASHTQPSFDSGYSHETVYELQSHDARLFPGYYLACWYPGPKAEASDTGRLGWEQLASEGYPAFVDTAQSTWCRESEYTATTSVANFIWRRLNANNDCGQTSYYQDCEQSGHDQMLYSTRANYDLYDGAIYSASVVMDLGEQRCDSVDPLSQHNEPHGRAGPDKHASHCFDSAENDQLLNHTGSHFDNQADCISPVIDDDYHPWGNDLAAGSNTLYNAADRPGINTSHATKELPCSHSTCGVKFKNAADRKRHLNTIHNEAGQSYRCVYDGCSKAYKVWTRLDSFKNHTKLHHPVDMEALVRDSRRERHGLPVAMTTPTTISQSGSRQPGLRRVKRHTFN